MKLLLDEKLSDRIIGAIADLMQKTTASQLSRRMQTFISAVCYMVIRLSSFTFEWAIVPRPKLLVFREVNLMRSLYLKPAMQKAS